MNALTALILALPELLKLIRRILESIEKTEKKSQLKSELKEMNEAIKSDDIERAIKLFNDRFSK